MHDRIAINHVGRQHRLEHVRPERHSEIRQRY
jgi:hypothetical protein